MDKKETKTLKVKKYIQKYKDDTKGIKVFFFDDGVCIGEASVTDYDGKKNNFLHGVVVKPKYRGMHYGTMIVKYMIKEYNVDTLYVALKNKVAIHIYKKFGFKLTNDTFIKEHERTVVMKRKPT